jgi:hypothetical protein
MPIHFPEPPEDVLRVAGLDHHGELGGMSGANLDDIAATERVVPLPPQPVFTAGLDAMSTLDEPRKAMGGQPNWRVTRWDETGQAAAIEVLGEPSADPVLSSGDDRFSDEIRAALRIATRDDRVAHRPYEARLLRVPGLSLLALWLHAREHPDLFVPFQAVGDARPRQLYERDEFIGFLRDAANRQLEAFSEAERPDELGS